MLLFLIILVIETRMMDRLDRQAAILATPGGNTIESSVIGGRFDTLTHESMGIGTTLQDLTLTDSLTVLGNTLFGKTSIAGGLTVDGSVSLNTQGVQTLGSTLYLQQNKLAPLDLMSGALRINTDGSVGIAGNLNIQGVLGATSLVPLSDTLTVDLSHGATNPASFGALIIKGPALFTNDITASGTGKFSRIVSPVIETSRLQFSQSGESNAIGTGTIPAGLRTMNILSNAVTQNSKIFVSPVSVSALPVSVTHQTPAGPAAQGGFTVETASPTLRDLDFNWFILN